MTQSAPSIIVLKVFDIIKDLPFVGEKLRMASFDRFSGKAAGLPYAAVGLYIILAVTGVEGQLSSTFYEQTCPEVLPAVKSVVKAAVAKERRIGASLLRLHFHDCFVNGCDGSILLDDTATFIGEKTATPNNNSVRGFEVIDSIKAQVEGICKETVSCADILAIAARDSVVELGGPTWTVLLGRRDSRTASKSTANNDIPPPTSNLTNLISKFQAQGLSIKDLVVLSGGHTIGQARCTNFRGRIYNDTNIDPIYSNYLQAKCPQSGGDNNLSPMDLVSPTFFDNNYYRNLQLERGILHSDQELFKGGGTIDCQVKAYAFDSHAFAADFAVSMVKMGNIKPLIGTNGEIRRNCRKRN